jgi:hypothetical protein
MYYFTAAYHSVFHYDEVHRRSSKPTKSPALPIEGANSPASPDEGSRLKCGMTNTSDSFLKSTGEESYASSVPATNGMNETRHQKEDNFQ